MPARDYEYMTRAVRLARQGLYTTHPNPRVGCVLVKDGRIIGEGYHRRAGEPHAERNALARAGTDAKDATVYVTLEPCCHYGRTPPCTEALIEAAVGRVVVAMEDPNPLVAGRGIELLREAGIQVEVGVLAHAAKALNPGFSKRMRTGLPYVRCKLAASLDGRTAMASGESQWITAAAARRDVQLLRARSAAIVTGIGTAIADDPSLNVRLGPEDLAGVETEQDIIQPVRVVLDSHLRLPPDARMLGLPGQTIVVCVDAGDLHRGALEAAGARVVEFHAEDGQVDLPTVFRFLAQQEINEVLLECGPTLAGAALAAGLVDELVLYLAPHLMGDAARGLFHLPGLERMSDRISLAIKDLRQIGNDIRITAIPLAVAQHRRR